MEKLMVEKSDELLYEFFKNLSNRDQARIGLMGGWAVHYLLKGLDVVHLGSRDIDIFFDPKKVKPGTIDAKLEKMGFHRHSTFRWVKIFHSETEQELHPEESKKHPIHNLSYVYFDLATPTPCPHAMPEPLLKKVYQGEKTRIKVKGVPILVPAAKVLIEMKLKAAPERTDAFKRTKDVADLYALLNSHPELWVVKQGQRARTKGLDPKLVRTFKQKLDRFKTDGTLADAAGMLRIDQNRLTELLERI